ncbi:hypothetical protein EYF80_031551 [Liparis tanakae]|uniref:Uncharacterized protein n=1 Tax=Liparis tanakae TaxID=230148 RepID=A0A4Z2GXR7_9TELE|nr:hypothetical protein EYF80_031551 [Liparis tanakae]
MQTESSSLIKPSAGSQLEVALFMGASPFQSYPLPETGSKGLYWGLLLQRRREEAPLGMPVEKTL